MFVRASSVFVLALPLLASASAPLRQSNPLPSQSNPLPPQSSQVPPNSNQVPPKSNQVPPTESKKCNTGESLQCCQSTHAPTSTDVAGVLSNLGIAVSSLTGVVGLTCSDINVIGVSGKACSAKPVCCSNNSFNGVVALGCTPVKLNL